MVLFDVICSHNPTSRHRRLSLLCFHMIGGTWSTLLQMFRYFLISAPMLLLFLVPTDTVSTAPGQTFNFTASAGKAPLTLTVVMVKDTWFGASKYCDDNNLGTMMYSGFIGRMFVFLRHQLFLDGWNNTDFLWTGMVKPISVTTFYRNTDCRVIAHLVAENITSDVQQCLAVNMTSDNREINWSGTDCWNKHYFVCSKPTGTPHLANLTNYVITDTYPDSQVNNSTSSLIDCRQKCTNSINGVASVYDVVGSVCQHYRAHVHDMPVHVTVESNMNLNNVVYVKNLSNAIEYLYPDSGYKVTENSGENVPLTVWTNIGTGSEQTDVGTPVVTTMSTPVVTTMSSQSDPSVTPTTGCEENTTRVCLCEQDSVSSEELKLKVEQLRKELTVEKSSLSSYKRKRVSAPDDRTSAQVIGVAGALIIAGVLFSIIILDLQHLMKCASRLKAKF